MRLSLAFSTRSLNAFLVAVALASPALGADTFQLPAGAEHAAQQINAATISAPTRFLADDLLEGRGPATRGDQLARLYIASFFETQGLQPGGPNGAWDQPVEMVGVKANAPKLWSFHGAKGDVDLAWWDDYIAGSGVQAPSAQIRDAELVFVGYGIQAPEYQWDDFKGADLKGKVLVMMNNDPDWDPKLFEGNRRLYYGRWTYKYESAARQGAAGAIIIHTTPSAGYPWQVVQTSWSGEQFSLPAEGQPSIQVAAWATEAGMKKILATAGQDLDKLVAAARSRAFKPVPLGIKTSITLQNEVHQVRSGNVIGVLPGSDPKLKDEYVVFSAHHDHLGIGRPDAKGDAIYNGALDNASGVGQLLAIVRAFKALPQPPRRSILFVAFAAEEQGLLGSEYFARHPPVPAGRIAANFNYDGGNIWGKTKDVVEIGRGKSDLDAVADWAAARQGRTVEGDQFPDRGFFYRSDQFNLSKVGVPAVHFSEGTDFIGKPAGWGRATIEAWEKTHYHQPSDQIEPDWNWDGMIEDAQLGFYCGLIVADRDVMPQWKKGDEFEPARQKALAATSR